jgi:superfamily II DNA helicase RecQ
MPNLTKAHMFDSKIGLHEDGDMLDVRRSIKRRRDFDRDACGHLTKKVCTREFTPWSERDKLHDPFVSFRKRQVPDLYAFLAQNRNSGSDTLNCQNPHSPLNVFADMAEPCREQMNSFQATRLFESLKIDPTQRQDLDKKMGPELKSQFSPTPAQSRELVIKRSCPCPDTNAMIVSKRPYFSPLPRLSYSNSNQDSESPFSGIQRSHFPIDEGSNLPFTPTSSFSDLDGPSKPGSILYQSKHCTIELLD